MSRVRRFYDRDPAAYHRGSVVTERVLGRWRRKVGESVTGRLLDVGFGTGLSLPHYPPSVEVVGVDASLGMLRFARQEASERGRAVRLVQVDAEHLAFPDQSFDSVAFNLCLCTIPDPAWVLQPDRRAGSEALTREHLFGMI